MFTHYKNKFVNIIKIGVVVRHVSYKNKQTEKYRTLKI